MIKKFLQKTGGLLVASALFAGSLVAQTCPTGLVSYWKMNETSGITHTDFKNGHNAVSNNAITADEFGVVGYARVFNTSDINTGDKVTIANNSAFDLPAGSSFTIIYWAKWSEVSYNSPDDHMIFSKGDWVSGNPSTAFIGSGINGSGRVNFLLYDNNHNYLELESDPGPYQNDAAWHQIALVRNNDNNMNILYIDGQIYKSGTVSYTGSFINSQPIEIGNLLSNGINHYFFRGSVDEVAFYNRALSQTEIVGQRTNALSGMGICDGQNAVILSTPKVTATVNMPYTYTVRAGGVQANMTYSLLTAPTGMTINAGSGLIEWTPTSISQNGLVKVRAVNNYPPADTQTFRINIAQGTPCPADLALLLKLDESNGPTYADHYGSHNGNGISSPVPISGKINVAQNFSTSTKIDIPDNADEFEWTGSSNFSFEAWIKPANVDNDGMVVLGRINVWEGAEYAQWQFGVNSGGYANFELFDNHSNGIILTGTSILDDGNWHHLVAVRDGTANMNKLYVDGELQKSESFTYSYTFKSDVQPNAINLGYIKRASSPDEYHFVGGIDEVAVFNKALTDAQVISFYNNGHPVGHCSEGNFAPVITSTPVLNGAKDALYTYQFTVDDYDATDTLTLSAVTKPAWLNFNWTAGQKTATLSGTPGSGNVGNNAVTLRVNDRHINIDQSFTINVINTNTLPTVTSTAITTANEDSQYSYTLTVDDADVADVIGMSVANKPAWLNFTYTAGNKSAVLSGTPDDADVGNNSVDISITDGHETIHATWTIAVSAVNDVPVISAQSTLSMNEDATITLQKANFTITDEDNALNELSIQVVEGTNYTFSGNTVTPTANFNGELTVNVKAKDAVGESEIYHAIITVNAVNDAPVVTSTPSLTGIVGEIYTYIFDGSDVDNGSLIKSVVEKPNWLQFSAETGLLTGTPAVANEGQNLVILRLSDGVLETEQNFTIVVGPNAVNDLDAAGIKIYPVPAREYLNIIMEAQSEETQIEVISMGGQVAAKDVIPSHQATYRMELKNIQSGVYFLKIFNSKLNNFGRFTIVE